MPTLNLLSCLVLAAMPMVPRLTVLGLAANCRFRAVTPGEGADGPAGSGPAAPTRPEATR
jgi:hypothetical protein